MPKPINSLKDNSKPIRVQAVAHQTLSDRAAQLSQERGLPKPMSLPAYIAEASAFFENNRPKQETK